MVKYRLAAPIRLAKRQTKEPMNAYRTFYQRDRDRILYSKAFRRLSGKTQVFLPISHDHVRTRLTHTLEVAQIARVTARNLNLDEDLAEAIALGHDIGHTPFGHVGERILNFIMNNCETFGQDKYTIPIEEKGFKHNLQSVRVACHLEKTYKDLSGMNLSNFTLWGIKHHSKTTWEKRRKSSGEPIPCEFSNNDRCYLNLNSLECLVPQLHVAFYDQYNKNMLLNGYDSQAWSFEAYVVEIADEIAQRHHDLEDALYMRIVTESELCDKIRGCFGEHFDDEDKDFFENLTKNTNNAAYFIPIVSKLIVNMLNKNLIRYGRLRLSEIIKMYNIKSLRDFSNCYTSIDASLPKASIQFEPSFGNANDRFKKYLKNRILNCFEVQRMDGKGTYIIRRLFKAYMTNPRQLHDGAVVDAFNLYNGENKSIADIDTADLGKLRDEIGGMQLQSDKRFQLCLLRAICDYVAGMTDNFAMSEYKKLYGDE